MTKEIVGKVTEIPPGGRRIIVPWKGQAGIGIFNIQGSFYAIRNLCPHRLGPLCSGQLADRTTSDFLPGSDPAAMTGERVGQVIRCPWHLWEFDLKTGQCLVDPRVSVRTYPVTIQDDNVVVECDLEKGSVGSNEYEKHPGE